MMIKIAERTFKKEKKINKTVKYFISSLFYMLKQLAVTSFQLYCSLHFAEIHTFFMMIL